jgi:transketolase
MDGFDYEIGKAITMREGTDVTVIAAGRTVLGAVEASEIAAQSGLSVRVLDMHTIKPIDKEAIMKRRNGNAPHHHRRRSQHRRRFGQRGREVIASSGKACAMRRLGFDNVFSIVGYPDDLLHYYKLDADGILESVQELLKAEIESDDDWEDED